MPAARGRGTALVLEDHLGWPFAVDRIAIAVDGKPQYISREPRPGLVGRLDLAPGQHILRLEAVTSYPSGSAGSDCRVRFRTTKTVRVDAPPASMILDLYQKSLVRRFDERPDVVLRVHGRSEGPLAGPAAMVYEPPQCNEPDLLGATLCRTTAKLNQARRERDIIKLHCYSEKLAAMRATVDVIDRARTSIDDGGSAETAHARAVIAVARQKVGELWGELEQCVTEYPAEDFGEERVVFEAGCTGLEPLSSMDE
jgi:hypothetical protein